MQKRIVSLLLVLVMLVGLFPAPVRATETDSNVDSGMTVEGTNGFGNLLSAELQAEYEEETQDTGNYSVLGLEITGNTATVEYASMEEAVLVVALYTEDGLQLLTSGKTTVDPTEDIATVTIEGNMPEYFQASAYLVDTYDFSPLCASYDTPMYTREMQELLASTVEDYDADRVLQLDEDKTTNFAVYAEDTILIEEQPGVNTVASVNDETSTYVIENADESITSLREGDIFAYPYGDNEILIVKVASISVKNGTATITGADLNADEVFSHLKIDGEGNTSNAEVDASTADEGVSYLGKVDDNTPQTRASGSLTAGTSVSFGLDIMNDKDFGFNVKVVGDLKLSLKVNISYYATFSYQHVEMNLTAGYSGSLNVSGKYSYNIPLGKIKIPMAGGVVSANFDMKFALEISDSVEIKFEHEVKLGFYITHTAEGWRKDGYSSSEKPGWTLEHSDKVIVGLKLGPTIEVGPRGILAEFSGEVFCGLEAKLSISSDDLLSKDTHHLCKDCYSGEINGKFTLALKAKFFKSKKLSLSAKVLDLSFKVCDIYCCKQHKKLGFSTCPNIGYKVIVTLVDATGKPILNTTVNAGTESAKTNKDGVAVFVLPVGEYIFRATSGGKAVQYTQRITDAQKISLRLDKPDPNSSGGRIPGNATDDNITDDTTSGTCGENVTWKITPDGVLKISGTGLMWDMRKPNTEQHNAPWYIVRDQIKRVEIENGVTRIGAWAFQDYTNIESVVIPSSVTSIGAGAFFGCSKLSGVTIPKGITTIEAFTFRYCDGLTSVKIPDGVTTIRDYAFDRCTNLTSVSIPDSVTSIDEGAFYCCYALDNVTLPGNLITLGDWAFTGCTSLSKITIPNSVTTIGIGTFKVCEKLLSVVIPNSVTSIGDTAFANCDSLTNVTIPDSVTSIGYLVFGYCDRLSSVTIPNSVTSIGEGAFSNCGCLTDIYYTGTKDQWNKISISTDNDNLISATVYYNTTGPAAAVEILPAETATEDIPKLDAIYGGEYGTEERENYTLKTAAFTDLVPGEAYLLLALMDLETEDALAADNLLYIDQAVAGEDGTLAFEYVQRTPATVSYVMACGASNKNLENAEITFPEMTADGTVHAVDPTVAYEGTTLTEGTDYVLLGDVTYTEAGTYTCFVRGVHRYTGLAECSYTVAVPEEEPVTPPTEETTPQETTPEETKPQPKPTEPEDTKPTEPDEPKYENPFEDVFEADYYYDPVLWAVNEGITNGMDATHFAPAGTCTRAQIVTFLWRANGSPASGGTNPFTDVPADAWYTDAVLWAVENGITTGTSATTFSPDAGCTRGQVATFLWRSQGQPSVNGENIFTDIAPGAYYYDAVLWAVANGITNGMGEGLFAPDATCTRGQIVTFLYRAMA